MQSDIKWPKVLLFLGAGASKPLGLPLMTEFWDLLINSDHLIDDTKDVLIKFLEFNKSKSETSIKPDLELILELTEKYKKYYDIMFDDKIFGWDESKLWEYNRGPPKMPSKTYFSEYVFRWFNKFKMGYIGDHLRYDFWFSTGLSRLDSLLRRTMFSVYWPVESNSVLDLYSPMIEFLIDMLNLSYLPIFTTNYDQVVEVYCRYKPAKLINGFENAAGRLRWEPMVFETFSPEANRQNVLLFKLHGSISWRRENTEIYDCGLSLQDTIKISTILYPTQTKGYVSEEPFRTAYQNFEEYLLHVSTAIIIGYSFRDPFILNIMKNCELVNENLHFIVVSGPNVEAKLGTNAPKHSVFLPFRFEFGSNAKYLEALKGQLKEEL